MARKKRKKEASNDIVQLPIYKEKNTTFSLKNNDYDHYPIHEYKHLADNKWQLINELNLNELKEIYDFYKALKFEKFNPIYTRIIKNRYLTIKHLYSGETYRKNKKLNLALEHYYISYLLLNRLKKLMDNSNEKLFHIIAKYINDIILIIKKKEKHEKKGINLDTLNLYYAKDEITGLSVIENEKYINLFSEFSNFQKEFVIKNSKLREKVKKKEEIKKKLKKIVNSECFLCITFFSVIWLISLVPNYWNLYAVFGIVVGIVVGIVIIIIIFTVIYLYIYKYYNFKKLKKTCDELRFIIQNNENKLELNIQEKKILVLNEVIRYLINEGEMYFNEEDFSRSLEKYNNALEILNKIVNHKLEFSDSIIKSFIDKGIRDKITLNIKKVKDIINEQKIKQIELILKEGDIFKLQNDYKKALQEYNKALSMGEKMSDSEVKDKTFETIRLKIDKIYQIQIQELVNNGIELVKQKLFKKAELLFNKALEESNKIYFLSEKKEIQKIIMDNFDLLYLKIINEKIKTGDILREQLKFDSSLQTFYECLDITEKIYSPNTLNDIKKKLNSLIYYTKISKIKNIILSLSIKFDRLHISEIVERCNEKEELVKKAAIDMINKKEIYAEYFKSTKSVVFDKQANLAEIDILINKYREWERKKNDKI